MFSSRMTRIALALALTLAFTVGAANPAFAVTGAARRKVIATITATAKKSHVSTANIKALVTLAKRESSYNPKARNGSCKGLFQLKTKASRGKWTNAAWNTKQAISYVKRRYGSPLKALRHSYRYGWY